VKGFNWQSGQHTAGRVEKRDREREREGEKRGIAIPVTSVSMPFLLSLPVYTVLDRNLLPSGLAAPDAPAQFEEGAGDEDDGGIY
jgi:hypothetical protein